MSSPSPAVPRTSERAIDPAILARWSPRAFDASMLDEDVLLTVIEAARWAPSAFNAQPWRFHYELRGGRAWEDYVSILLPFNAAWAKSASALLFIVSEQFRDVPGQDTPAPLASASFDSGAAWGLLALQATRLGLHTHAMAGFDPSRASQVLGLDERERTEVAVAIGRIGEPGQLSEALQAREFPSPRRPLAEIVRRGTTR